MKGRFGYYVVAALAAIPAVLVAWLFIQWGVSDILDGAQANPSDDNLVAWGVAQTFALSWIFGYAVWRLAALLFAWQLLLEPAPTRPGGTARQVEHGWNQRMGRQ